jgi:hypothetical protein
MGASTKTGSGVVHITNCTLTANTAQGGAGSLTGNGGDGFGGALFNLDGSVTLNDATVAANTVSGGSSSEGNVGLSDGGAVYNLAFGNLIQNGGAVSATLTLNNSILSNTTGGTDLASNAINGKNTNTAAITGTSNLVGSKDLTNTSIASGVITVTTNPNLGPLQNNGGSTFTMALTSSSPAYNAGNKDLVPADVTTDQRGQGFARVVNGRLDLGAFEVQSSTSQAPIPRPTPTPTSSSSSSSETATASQLSRVALDALLVAEGIFTGKHTLSGLGVGDLLLFTNGLPTDVQSQLRSAFTRDTLAVLAALNLTGTG